MTCVTIVLSFLPELLKYCGGPAIAPPTDGAVRKRFVVDNMGCEACVNAVERILTQHPGVVYGRVTEFERGEVEVFVADETANWVAFSEQALDSRLRKHGYELHERGWETESMKLGAKSS
eukprot:CAMPEP_0179218100 /NCGR_PEP_ID=MMETSP0797-20121207/4282_1 /TAXON_ID=47934 /ORGANISM="Dinophysis acuminata, Strain DAEP01" /LENGTH=119 /DNA_ID=CAMNT_0020924403 /DNA_START=53 /DNA_END=409 /DNA_ORIENTATION=+